MTTLIDNARVRKAKVEDIAIIAENMRQADKDEVWASDNLTPQEALQRSFDNSTLCYTVEVEGKPEGMFGAVPTSIINKEACVWLLVSEDFCMIRHKFLRYSKKFIQVMLDHYSKLYNYVSVKNTFSIKWLKFCGAIFEEAKPYGKEGQDFQYFYFEKQRIICSAN